MLIKGRASVDPRSTPGQITQTISGDSAALESVDLMSDYKCIGGLKKSRSWVDLVFDYSWRRLNKGQPRVDPRSIPGQIHIITLTISGESAAF